MFGSRRLRAGAGLLEEGMQGTGVVESQQAGPP